MFSLCSWLCCTAVLIYVCGYIVVRYFVEYCVICKFIFHISWECYNLLKLGFLDSSLEHTKVYHIIIEQIISYCFFSFSVHSSPREWNSPQIDCLFICINALVWFLCLPITVCGSKGWSIYTCWVTVHQITSIAWLVQSKLCMWTKSTHPVVPIHCHSNGKLAIPVSLVLI